MKQWYTLYTQPHCEHQVAAVLEQRKIHTYLPEIESLTARRKREKKPFFPCYLFTQVDLEMIGISALQWTPGLRSIVSVDQQPVPLGDEIIELIQQKVSLNSIRPDCPFMAGDVVRITAGPLRDMLAIFDQPTTLGERVQVLLAILGHVSRTQVNLIDLEKTPPDTKVPELHRPRRTRGRGRYIKGAFSQAS